MWWGFVEFIFLEFLLGFSGILNLGVKVDVIGYCWGILVIVVLF